MSSSYVDARLVQSCTDTLGSMPSLRMATWAHDKHSPPDYLYAHAVSAHSAAVQLYARSGQLLTADLLFTRNKLPNKECHLGCKDDENMQHIFVKCATYQAWWLEAWEQVIEKTMLKLETMKIEGPIWTILVAVVESLFIDDSLTWPLHLTMYSLDQIPDLDTLIPSGHGLNKITLLRLKAHISSDWHTLSIRLASRIFSDYQRRMANLNNIPFKDHFSRLSQPSQSLCTYISNCRQ